MGVRDLYSPTLNNCVDFQIPKHYYHYYHYSLFLWLKIFFVVILKNMEQCVIWPEFGIGWSEDFIQMWIARESHRAGLVFHADAGGANKGRIGGNKMKLAGARKGWPDLCYWTPRLVYIELKTLVGKQSKEQRALQDIADMVGIEYHLVKVLDGPDGWNKVRSILGNNCKK